MRHLVRFSSLSFRSDGYEQILLWYKNNFKENYQYWPSEDEWGTIASPGPNDHAEYHMFAVDTIEQSVELKLKFGQW